MKSYRLLFLIILIVPTFLSWTEESISPFDALLSEYEASSRQQPTIIRQSPEEILELLVNRFNLPTLLIPDFFKRTNPIVVRNILDNPVVGRTRIHDENACLQLELFYHHIEQDFFTHRRSFLDAIISFDNQDLLDFVTLASRTLSDVNLTGLPELLNALKSVKIQERQTGFMLSAAGNYENWRFIGRTPLYWVEHNFYLTRLEQAGILNSQLISTQHLSDQEIAEMEAFFQRLLVADRFGLGDTRFVVEYLVHTAPEIDVFAGLAFTIPTAATISRGFVGGKFNKSLKRPEFSLVQIIDLLTPPTPENQELALQLLANFAKGAVCQLTANLADRGLGNNGHFGFAPTLELCRQVGDRLALELYAAVEFFAPHRESRYFIEQKNVARLNQITTEFQDFNEEQAAAALVFLNETVINTVYPFVIRTDVRPGTIVKITPAIHIFLEQFTAWLGYDFWWQGDEEFKAFHAPELLLNRLKITEGIKPRAQQHRLFFDLRWYTFSSKHADWELSFKGDWAVYNLGIGSNFTTAIGIQGLF